VLCGVIYAACSSIIVEHDNTNQANEDRSNPDFGVAMGGDDAADQPTQMNTTSPIRDVVDQFLSIVEQYERNKENCTPGTTFNLGDGVVAQYGVVQFHTQAMAAVNRANFLTRIWKGAVKLTESEYFFYAAVRLAVNISI